MSLAVKAADFSTGNSAPAFKTMKNSAIKTMAALAILLSPGAFAEPFKNGFDLEKASVPEGLVIHGGPPKDGIPAIDEPVFESVKDASWLEDDDKVIGVSLEGQSKAYPIPILNWHEIVNDSFNGKPVLVTFCPLCGTGIVFRPKGDGRTDFGVSGLLYNSDVLLYDRETESLWSQILAEAVSGQRLGEKLDVIPSRHTTWGSWKKNHPNTLVLSRDTGSRRNYDRDPYAGYEKSSKVFFPLVNMVAEGGLHPKERVLGLRLGNAAKAYPFSVLTQLDKEEIPDVVGDKEVIVHWDKEAFVAWATDSNGNSLPGVDGFWFAWYAFYPSTEVLQAN